MLINSKRHAYFLFIFPNITEINLFNRKDIAFFNKTNNYLNIISSFFINPDNGINKHNYKCYKWHKE